VFNQAKAVFRQFCTNNLQFLTGKKAKMSSFVAFKNVGKIYHMGEVDIEALNDVNFVIDKGGNYAWW
jgi:hypothetical protein